MTIDLEFPSWTETPDLNSEMAQNLVTQLQKIKIPARISGGDLVSEMQQADGLINATPVGLFQYPGNPFPVEGFHSQRWAFDAVYTPEKTSFLYPTILDKKFLTS